jgi:amidase
VPADDLAWLDAVALRDLVADGEVTPAELAEGAIGRIDAANPALNAVVVPLPDVGRAIAADPALPRGPFHGVPFLLKDVGACLAGLPLYMGNGLLRSLDWRAPADTVLGARFRAAGLVTVGKTTLPEFGCQPTTQPIAFGACRNPWDPTRSTAGSSGGAAAAVAAGMVPVAHASDIGGSIRLPAAWCGVVGLKPSRGRTSSLPITDPNLVEHVITRSVRDTAAFLDAIGGAEETDVYHLPPPAMPYATTLSDAPDPLRIGYVESVEATGVTVAADCVAAVTEAARLLEAIGHHVEPGGPPRLFDEEFATHHLRSAGWEFQHMLDGLAAAIGRPLTPADVEPYSWALASVGASLTDATYSASQTWQRAYTAEVSAWWANDFDLLLTPAAGEPPAVLDGLLPPPADPLSILPRFERIWCFAAPFSVTGQPAISLPVGRTATGLPVGIQLVAALGREDLLIRVAAQLEQAAPWRDRRPPAA